jgi:hypothetical protein
MLNFFHWEDVGSDFPFYRDSPSSLTFRQWWLVVAAAAAAFMALALTAPLSGAGLFWPFLPAIGLAAIPLLALARVTPEHWTCLFGRVGLREVRLMLGFGVLNIVFTMSLGAIVMAFFSSS